MELTPDFNLTINGNVVPKDRVISINATCAAGIVLDHCEFELDDFDDSLSVPKTEAKVIVELGYKETGLRKVGVYFIKGFSIEGGRRSIHITANAAPKIMYSQETQGNPVNFEEKIAEMGKELDFKTSVSELFNKKDLDGQVQFSESDLNYAVRWLQKYGGLIKLENEHLMAVSAGSGKSTSGKALPIKVIKLSDVESYAWEVRDIENFGAGGTSGKAKKLPTAVRATWYDEKTGDFLVKHAGDGKNEVELETIYATKEEAKAAAEKALVQGIGDSGSGGKVSGVRAIWLNKETGEYLVEHAGDGKNEKELDGVFKTKEEAKAAAEKALAQGLLGKSSKKKSSTSVIANWFDKDSGEYKQEKAGDGDHVIMLKEIFGTKEDARAAALATLNKTVRFRRTLKFTTSGRTDLFSECPITLLGFPPKIPADWMIARVDHKMDSNGFSTSVECVARG